jgi:hypothetical protein
MRRIQSKEDLLQPLQLSAGRLDGIVAVAVATEGSESQDAWARDANPALQNGRCCPGCVPHVVRVTWQLQVVSFFAALHASVDGDVSQPYYWSRISCCGALRSPDGIGTAYDVVDPATIAAFCDRTIEPDVPLCDPLPDVLPACELPAMARSDPLWSHSLHCSNWFFVRDFVQRFIGIRSPISATVSVLALPIGASLADMYGRRPIIIFAAAMTLAQMTLYFVAAHPFFVEVDRQGYLVYGASALNALGSASGSAVHDRHAFAVAKTDQLAS